MGIARHGRRFRVFFVKGHNAAYLVDLDHAELVRVLRATGMAATVTSARFAR